MKKVFLLTIFMIAALIGFSQNVGIGTTTPLEKLHVVGNRSLFETNYFGIGAGEPATGFTSFQINKNINSYLGMYINSGTTGTPFYGYALNGSAKSYTSFNSTTSQFEYHQTSDATPDFFINGNTKAVFNTGFVGIGTSTPTTGFTGFAMKSSANTFYGSYIDAGPTGIPFYGYALNGVAKSYLSFHGPNNSLEYHQTSDATPEFYINGNTKAVFNTGFVGIGTGTPTNGFTGFAMKNNVNTYYGQYVDAGLTGIPFYGYALNGVAAAYTTYNGQTSQFEYHHTTDATPDFAVSNTQALFPIQTFLGLGTSTPTTGSATGFTMKNTVNGYYGMYIDAGTTGRPFYGYALNGLAKAWTELNGNNNNWELNYGGVALTVTATGSLGVGTTPSQKLDVAGTIHALNLNGGATTLSTDAVGNIIRTPSDGRLKNNEMPIDNALSKVMQMKGLTYNFIDGKRFGTNRQMGFLAQDLENIVPEAVSSGGEYKSVNYPVLTALLTEAVKEQQKEIELLMKKIEKLESVKK